MSKIGTTQVERIARLARINLSPEEVAKMSVELGTIMEFVEQLQSIDVTDVEPTDQVTGLVDVWREDEVKSFGDRELLLKNAPQTKDGYIVVKRVLNG
ncbi:MAG TPA: Asp-tRNA(Asn)/Glu-tRNA(Gln) amidotransferase subunit GatC [Candidatus Saccharimonadia bacterium]